MQPASGTIVRCTHAITNRPSILCKKLVVMICRVRSIRITLNQAIENVHVIAILLRMWCYHCHPVGIGLMHDVSWCDIMRLFAVI